MLWPQADRARALAPVPAIVSALWPQDDMAMSPAPASASPARREAARVMGQLLEIAQLGTRESTSGSHLWRDSDNQDVDSRPIAYSSPDRSTLNLRSTYKYSLRKNV